jgi:hypothetical protein
VSLVKQYICTRPANLGVHIGGNYAYHFTRFMSLMSEFFTGSGKITVKTSIYCLWCVGPVLGGFTR